jgi:hypothetical protein
MIANSIEAELPCCRLALPQTSSIPQQSAPNCMCHASLCDQQDTRNECEGAFNIYLGPMIVRECTCAILVAVGKLSLCSPHSQLDLLLSSSSGTNRKSNLSLPMVAATPALLINTGLIFCRRQINCRSEHWKSPHISGQRASR